MNENSFFSHPFHGISSVHREKEILLEEIPFKDYRILYFCPLLTCVNLFQSRNRDRNKELVFYHYLLLMLWW